MALSTLAWTHRSKAPSLSQTFAGFLRTARVADRTTPIGQTGGVQRGSSGSKDAAEGSPYAGSTLVGSVVAAAAVLPGTHRKHRRRSNRHSSVVSCQAAAQTAVLEKTAEETTETPKDDLEKENEQLLEELAAQVERINSLEEEIEKLDNDGLRAKTAELRDKIRATGKIDEPTLNYCCAVLREAVWRVLELWYFDVQVLGGLVLNRNRLAEMKTGEGKTIVALLPAFTAALEGKGGVFIVTPNDYLARRDAENVGQVLRFLGLTVGLVQSTMEYTERQEAYKCDVVYLTNAELGFDYLRDNLAVYTNQVVQSKNFYFCLVDEADSILIDEARTPLIISESVPAVPRQFEAAREIAVALSADEHYTVDFKNMNAFLTEKGERAAEELLGVDNLWEPEEAWILYVSNAVKAKELFRINEQYIIRDGKVAIVDTFTGRVLEGRRWSDGMHQAIETKERIQVSVRSQVTAQITYQSLFRLFPRICAMTGTALTEAAEFEEIYQLRSTGIPTARPMVRRDYPDVIYKTEEAKLNSIVKEIALNYERNGRPILIGTSNVKMSEEIVSRLKEKGVEPQLLNARPESVARENETIAQAGRLGMVTVSTNMAGRGTDIILGGNYSSMAQILLRGLLSEALLPVEQQAKVPVTDESFYPTEVPDWLVAKLENSVATLAETERGKATATFLKLEELVALISGEAPFDPNSSAEALNQTREAYGELKKLFKDSLASERDGVIKAGGLYVLGTTRHESRRIDNQLRGRAGRQGDPGSSRFFVSLQDEVFRVFGGNKIETLLDRFRLGDEIPLESQIVNDTLDRVQKAVEEFFKQTRTKLFEFDKVISKQRELTYANRKKYVVASDELMRSALEEWSEASCETFLGKVKTMTPEERSKEFEEYFGFDEPVWEQDPEKHMAQLRSSVLDAIAKKWEEYAKFRPGFGGEAGRIATTVTIDDEWKLLLQKMDALKQTVSLATYKGSDPLKEYQVQGFKMYQRNANKYKARVVSRWLRSKPKKDAKP